MSLIITTSINSFASLHNMNNEHIKMYNIKAVTVTILFSKCFVANTEWSERTSTRCRLHHDRGFHNLQFQCAAYLEHVDLHTCLI